MMRKSQKVFEGKVMRYSVVVMALGNNQHVPRAITTTEYLMTFPSKTF